MILKEGRKKYEYIDSLVQTGQTFSEDTVMEFEIKATEATKLSG